jgi:hypothetical protein
LNDSEPIRVIIRNPEGQYLARGEREWSFTSERQRAIVFDFQRDHVAEYLQMIRKAHGPALEAVTIEPGEIHEICDICKQPVKSMEIFFDGQRFICAGCRKASEGR